MMIEFVLYNPSSDVYSMISIMLQVRGSGRIEKQIFMKVGAGFMIISF